MDGTPMDTVTQRLDRLERVNRGMKVAVAVVLILASTVVVMGQAFPQMETEIRSRRFVVVDRYGKARAFLGLGSKGPRIILIDPTGTRRAMLGLDREGPAFGFYDADGKVRLALSLDSKGPAVGLRDANEKLRIGLGVAAEGPALDLYNAMEKRGAVLHLTATGPSILLKDTKGNTRVALAVTLRQGPILGLLDANERVIWRKP